MSDDNVVHIGTPQNWRTLCQVNEKKALLNNLHNVMIALRHDPAVRSMYGYDEMLRAPVILHEIGLLETCNRWITDSDYTTLQEWLQRQGMRNVTPAVVRDAVHKRAGEMPFHPVREYLQALVWDQVPRIGVWLPRYLGAPLNSYTQHIGRMFMVQMIARIAQPGCQADHMLVLEGPQGILKSSACRSLGGHWFSDHLPEITNQREASQHLRGKWVVEVAEMHAMNKVEATQLKSFITRTVEQYRPYYGHTEVLEPRQCVFIGTTNQDEYLRDPTGGRRFWPVKTAVDNSIDIPRLQADRDQLFAEACECFFNGDQWWPDTQFEREFIQAEQAARFQPDIWTERITSYIATRTRTSIPEIATDCLAIPSSQMTPAHGTRIAAVLKEHGWTPKRTSTERFWVHM